MYKNLIALCWCVVALIVSVSGLIFYLAANAAHNGTAFLLILWSLVTLCITIPVLSVIGSIRLTEDAKTQTLSKPTLGAKNATT